MGRKRKRLVPPTGIEVFELRIVLWFDKEGNSWTTAHIETGPDQGDPMRHEMLGVAHDGIDILKERYADDPVEEA